MVYKLNWNEEENKFEVLSYERDAESEPKSNIVGQNDGIFSSHLENPQIANLMTMAATTLLAEGSISMNKCRECGCYFTVSKEEADWYISKELGVPKRCYSCRRANKKKAMRKAAAESPEE